MMKDNPEMVCLGKIVAAHGIRGAVKILSFTDPIENIVNYSPISDESGKLYGLKFFKKASSTAIIATIPGINSRNDAESLKNTELFIEKEKLPALPDDEFYYDDLIGMNICSEAGGHLGVVVSVVNHGAGDVVDFTCAETNKIKSFIFHESAVIRCTQSEIYVHEHMIV